MVRDGQHEHDTTLRGGQQTDRLSVRSSRRRSRSDFAKADVLATESEGSATQNDGKSDEHPKRQKRRVRARVKISRTPLPQPIATPAPRPQSPGMASASASTPPVPLQSTREVNREDEPQNHPRSQCDYTMSCDLAPYYPRPPRYTKRRIAS